MFRECETPLEAAVAALYAPVVFRIGFFAGPFLAFEGEDVIFHGDVDIFLGDTGEFCSDIEPVLCLRNVNCRHPRSVFAGGEDVSEHSLHFVVEGEGSASG